MVSMNLLFTFLLTEAAVTRLDALAAADVSAGRLLPAALLLSVPGVGPAVAELLLPKPTLKASLVQDKTVKVMVIAFCKRNGLEPC